MVWREVERVGQVHLEEEVVGVVGVGCKVSEEGIGMGCIPDSYIRLKREEMVADGGEVSAC